MPRSQSAADLSTRALNRAALARQLLLRRAKLPVLEATAAWRRPGRSCASEAEGMRLLAFTDPDATAHDVRFVPMT